MLSGALHWGEAKPGECEQGDWRTVPVSGNQRSGGPGPTDICCHQAHCALYVDTVPEQTFLTKKTNNEVFFRKL